MITLTVKSQARNEFINITSQIENAVKTSGVQKGYCLLYVPHTTAGITVNEGADPSVKEDILDFLAREVPPRKMYRHSEGNSDAHIKSSLIGVSQVVLIENGRLLLGTWQAVFFCEFDGPRTRKVLLQTVET